MKRLTGVPHGVMAFLLTLMIVGISNQISEPVEPFRGLMLYFLILISIQVDALANQELYCLKCGESLVEEVRMGASEAPTSTKED